MVERSRNRVLNVRLLGTEVTMLAELAETEGVTVSEWIRNTVRREHAITARAKPRRKRKQP